MAVTEVLDRDGLTLPVPVAVDEADSAGLAAAGARDLARLSAARTAMQQANAAGIELFGSFLLSGEEFALPARSIREVVNFPERIIPIPLSPDYLEGVFTLRGTVIPVVNLARLFDPSAPACDRSQTIAIIDHEDVLVGILFQSTGEILRVRPEQRSTLQYKGRDGQDRHGVVAGTILLDDGARLLQVLDPAALIRIENVPQVLALRAASRAREQRHHGMGARRQAVSFRVGSASFAFDMAAIQEIIKVPELTPSVLNSSLCLGRMNFRGSPVAVVDFATLLHALPAGEARAPGDSPDQRVIVARIDESTIGFLVDSVDNIVSYFGDEVLAIPLLSKSRAGMFGGCLSRPDIGDIIFLDHKGIFSQTEIVDMRNGHDNLFRQEAGDGGTPRYQVQQTSRKAGRKVYITFTLEQTFAVEIKQIREIIDFTGGLSKPPGMPDFMRGMLNLRQKMISVVDLRRLYGMAPLEDSSNAKILIIERGDERFGLLVDAVENIRTIPDTSRFAAPKMMRSASTDDMSGEMDEVIDLDDGESGRQTLSVFQSDVLLQRLTRQWPGASLA
jgi:purine-binding chemotaxis protein CheW